MRKAWRYLGDPLCMIASAAYAANRWLIPVLWKGPFLRGHFNDLFFIPAALPPMLGLYHVLGLRPEETPPNWGEVASQWVVWSVAAEWVGPHLFRRATGDWWDVAAYAAGAGIAGVLWQTNVVSRRWQRGVPSHD